MFITFCMSSFVEHMCFSFDKKERRASSLACPPSSGVCLFTSVCLCFPAHLPISFGCFSVTVCLSACHSFSAALSLFLFLWHRPSLLSCLLAPVFPSLSEGYLPLCFCSSFFFPFPLFPSFSLSSPSSPPLRFPPFSSPLLFAASL